MDAPWRLERPQGDAERHGRRDGSSRCEKKMHRVKNIHRENAHFEASYPKISPAALPAPAERARVSNCITLG